MNKKTYLAELRKGLSGFPQEEIEERVTFYSEMIDDRMEEGLSESEAVSANGAVGEVVAQILAEIPITTLVKEKVKANRAKKAWEIVLLVLGSPVWLSLLIAVFAVILSVYAVLWSIIVSLWAIEASLAGCALGGTVGAVILAFQGNGLIGIAMLGASAVCAGLSIFMFFGCRASTKGILMMTKKMALGIKYLFVGKEK